MARLIDADALSLTMIGDSDLQGRYTATMGYRGQGRVLAVAYELYRRMIAEAPTVDAVEVVRCKDCKHGVWDEDEQMWECIVGVDLTGDPDIYSMFHEYNDGMHFCSYGERKKDD